MSDHEPSAEEMAEFTGVVAPYSVARAWLDAAAGSSGWEAAWPLLDPATRLVSAAGWLWARRQSLRIDPLGVATMATNWAALAGLGGTAWSSFCAEQERVTAQYLERLPPIDEWGTATKPRPVGIDQELVIFVPGVTETIIFAEDTERPAVPFLMRHGPEGWKVRAPFASTFDVAKWPPHELAPYLKGRP